MASSLGIRHGPIRSGLTSTISNQGKTREGAGPTSCPGVVRWNTIGSVGSVTDALPGRPAPLGAAPGADGTNFAVASSVAEGAEICLFDDAGHETRVRLPEYDDGVWHGLVPDVGPGQAYGFRVHGPYNAAQGLRCNPAKLLLDPYARAVRGEVRFGPEVFDYDSDDHDAPSFTMRHPDVPGQLRGTYAGLAHESVLSYLVLVNGWWEQLDFTIGDCRPGLPRPGLTRAAVIDTVDPPQAGQPELVI